jgi:hypothetical protein
MRLRFRRSASRYVRLAHLYSAVGIAILRSCYGQILRPRGHLPKFAYGLWRLGRAYDIFNLTASFRHNTCIVIYLVKLDEIAPLDDGVRVSF